MPATTDWAWMGGRQRRWVPSEMHDCKRRARFWALGSRSYATDLELIRPYHHEHARVRGSWFAVCAFMGDRRVPVQHGPNPNRPTSDL